MNIKKYIAAVLCAAMLPCCLTGCGNNDERSEGSDMGSETTLTESTSNMEEIKEIPTAEVNSTYKSVTVDGNTVNMDVGTVFRGHG